MNLIEEAREMLMDYARPNSTTDGGNLYAIMPKLVEELMFAREIIRSVLWINECRCDEAYTSRKMHEPNAICGELDDLADWMRQIETGSQLAKEEKKMTPKQFAETLLDQLEKAPQEISGPDMAANSRILCRLVLQFIESTEKWPNCNPKSQPAEKK